MNANDIWLIAGLGNPEAKYEGTRHNVGFEALDVAAETFGIPVRRSRFDALCGDGTVDGPDRSQFDQDDPVRRREPHGATTRSGRVRADGGGVRDPRDDLRRLGVLEQVAGRAREDGAGDVGIVVVGREDQHGGAARVRSQRRRHPDAVEAGAEAQVAQDHVRVHLTRQPQRLLPGGRGPDDGEVGRAVEQRLEP